MSKFSYEVPFVAFAENTAIEGNIGNVEAFFEVEHYNHNGAIPKEFHAGLDKEQDADEKFYSVSPAGSKIRRSMSVGNLNLDETKTLDEVDNIDIAMGSLQITPPEKSMGAKVYSESVIKSHRMTTRQDAKRISNRFSCASQRYTLFKRETKPAVVDKYVSMAEAVNQFHQKTPTRYHSQSKNNLQHVIAHQPLQTTIPQSPALKSKFRVRSSSVMSREEKELNELQEARKHMIKANPINQRILNGPTLKPNLTLKKEPTKPEPFKLTAVPVKKPIPSSPRIEFHAKPIPKSVLEPPQPIIKSNLCTLPVTPKFMRRMTFHKPSEPQIEPKCTSDSNIKLTSTKPKPFSFDQRDKEMFKKRDQLVNAVIKEEQKAREFHANPIPKKIQQMAQTRLNNTSVFGGVHNETMNKTSNTSTFKARPCTVVHKKPFQPKKEERTLTEITEFKLNTQDRAKERVVFAEKLKQKEEQTLANKQQAANQKLQQEHEEIAKLRKEAEIKANPIRRYKEVKPVSPKKLTSPKAPEFSKTGRIKNKENSEN